MPRHSIRQASDLNIYYIKLAYSPDCLTPDFKTCHIWNSHLAIISLLAERGPPWYRGTPKHRQGEGNCCQAPSPQKPQNRYKAYSFTCWYKEASSKQSDLLYLSTIDVFSQPPRAWTTRVDNPDFT